jgi:hypothetical protein
MLLHKLLRVAQQGAGNDARERGEKLSDPMVVARGAI